MRKINVSPDIFIPNLLAASREIGLCLLDRCGTQHAGSNLLIAGLLPIETLEITYAEPNNTLVLLDEILTGEMVAIFSLSYDFGRRLNGVGAINDLEVSTEPNLFIATFDALLVHDYRTGETTLRGNSDRFDSISSLVAEEWTVDKIDHSNSIEVRSNFTKSKYLAAIEEIKDQIRLGNTYQTNLTQQLSVNLPVGTSPASVFQRIRRQHPAPFAAFLERKDSTVVSASPERFFKVEGRKIFASPIKGTRRRGYDQAEDAVLRDDLLQSEKDRAENTMIVDLLRNDLGKVCRYGSVQVKELCKLQTLPSLFHLESTIEGTLNSTVEPSEIISALFPCGSITGAPKIRTMQIIDELEPVRRGLSMGTIGLFIPQNGFNLPGTLDLSVAIRTIVVRDQIAKFNVGGGIVIDSDPEKEYEESLLKAKALLDALGIRNEEINLQ